jgi:N-acetylglucosamine kinase-like BadF-type ATPase
MQYVLGIESGGTKTIAQLARLDGSIVARMVGPSIADVSPNPETVRLGLTAVLSQFGQLPATGEIQAVYVSLGGLNLQTVEAAARELLPGIPVEAHRESSGDVVCGCAPWWGFDVAVMVGTGTVALGRSADGRYRKVGGWGCWIEDPGSGFEIGRDALRAVTRMLDFGKPETSLLAAFVRHDLFRDSLVSLPAEALCEAGSRERHRDEIGEAVKAAYPHLDRRTISSLCPLVEDCANDGDEVAQQILEDAGERAADYALQLARHLDLAAPRIIAMGSVLLNVPPVFASFRDAIHVSLPAARVGISDFTLATGAVLRALELAGVSPEPELVDRLRSTAKVHHG